MIAAPASTERAKSQMYIQRYLPHLPVAGEILIFHRSGYNRTGVERIVEFRSGDQVRRFLQMAPPAEKIIIESGILLVKYG
jgi:polyphosphate kinase 2 (PPK2 family)